MNTIFTIILAACGAFPIAPRVPADRCMSDPAVRRMEAVMQLEDMATKAMAAIQRAMVPGNRPLLGETEEDDRESY